jgi:hypothetical protein
MFDPERLSIGKIDWVRSQNIINSTTDYPRRFHFFDRVKVFDMLSTDSNMLMPVARPHATIRKHFRRDLKLEASMLLFCRFLSLYGITRAD